LTVLIDRKTLPREFAVCGFGDLEDNAQLRGSLVCDCIYYGGTGGLISMNRGI